MEVIPERPGMVTPLAPTTESMTPWAKTLVAAKAAMRMTNNHYILNVGDLKYRKIKRQLK
jgi:hypothetical protein